MPDVNLIKHLPSFVAEYKEIQQIMGAENPEFNLLQAAKDKLQNNQYIISCDEAGISRFEKLLNIIPSPEDTVDSRISRCLMRWNESVPYTLKSLESRLDMMCGKGNYQIFPNFNDYEIDIIVSLELYGQTDELRNILSYMLPANIAARVRNNIYCKSEYQEGMGGAVSTAEVITVST